MSPRCRTVPPVAVRHRSCRDPELLAWSGFSQIPVRTAGTAARVASAADGRHRPGGLQERRVVDAVARRAWPASRPPTVGELVVGGAGAQRRPQVGLLAGEQAVADLAVGGQPDPVAVAAERPGDRARSRRRSPDRRRPGTARPARSRAARSAGLEQVELGVAARSKISSAVTICVAVPAVLGVERHLLDEPQLVAARRGTSRSSSGAWSSLTPRSSTALTFTGVEPGRRAAASSARDDVVRAGRAG